MVERGGRVVASKVPDASALSLMPHIEKRVLSESVLYTDEWKPYIRLARSGYQHRRIQHAQEIYVMGDMHTNTIEGFWSLVNRGITETHHAVSAKWLQVYLNEYAWRYAHRDDGRAMSLTLLLRSATTRL
jgi:transposase